MKLTGAQIFIECLKEQKVDTVFGFPGGSVLNIYDELYRHQDEIRHILTSHEQGAAHAADGYARATGKVGVCIATSGPGATNLVTGIAAAYMDSVPMVAFTGNVPLSLLGKDSFQEVDIAGITMPVTKHNYIVKDVTKLGDIIREAFYIAREGRPGPVLIDIPKDITTSSAEYTYCAPREIIRDTGRFGDDDIARAVSIIQQSKRPYIYAGGGVTNSDASKELLAFAELIKAPVGCSLMGQSCFPAYHEQYTGMIGMHGTKVSNMAVSESDLLIVVGARFSDRVVSKADRFARKAKILHIDIDPAEINKNIQTYHHILGDVKVILTQLTKNLEPKDRAKWIDQIVRWKQEYPLRVTGHNRRAKDIIETLSELTDHRAIITTEVGQHQIWAAQYYGYYLPRSFISSGGLGAMGFGTGASIGAKLGRPDRKVVNIAGDGSFRMNCNEVATAAHYRIPIVVLIMNNKTLGMVRQWQTLFFDKRYSQTDLDHLIDWVKLAEAFSAVGYRLPMDGDIKTVLEKALSETDRPVVVDCEIPRDDKVLPMVPPGAAIEDLILELDLEN